MPALPDEPFPRVNNRAETTAMIDALVASSADGDLQTKLHDRSKELCENGRPAIAKEANGCGELSVTERQRGLTWAQRLKRVFAIDIEVNHPGFIGGSIL